MSGAGKSSVVAELRRRARDAVDLDTPEWSGWVEVPATDPLTPKTGRDWRWREDKVGALLAAPRSRPLFVSGCAENMSRFYGMFELVILLSAPVEALVERLAGRNGGEYGASAEDRRKVAAALEEIEPLLRAAAHHEIDTRRAVTATVDEIVAFANRRS